MVPSIFVFWASRAPGWPETDSPRKVIAGSRVETRIRALGNHSVVMFGFSVGAQPTGKPLSLSGFFVPDRRRTPRKNEGTVFGSRQVPKNSYINLFRRPAKTRIGNQSGRHWADSGDTLCPKSYVFGLQFGPDPGPGEAQKVTKIAPNVSQTVGEIIKHIMFMCLFCPLILWF